MHIYMNVLRNKCKATNPIDFTNIVVTVMLLTCIYVFHISKYIFLDADLRKL